MSEHIPVLGPQFYSKLEGDRWWASPSRWSRGRSRRASSAHAAGADVGVAADLAGALVEDEVAPAGEADLGAVAAGAGAVQVEGRGRVGDVFVVDDQEVAGGVLTIGAAVDGRGPVQGEGRVVQGCGALEVLDEDALDDAGSAWAGIARPRTVVRPRRTIRSGSVLDADPTEVPRGPAIVLGLHGEPALEHDFALVVVLSGNAERMV